MLRRWSLVLGVGRAVFFPLLFLPHSRLRLSFLLLPLLLLLLLELLLLLRVFLHQRLRLLLMLLFQLLRHLIPARFVGLLPGELLVFGFLLLLHPLPLLVLLSAQPLLFLQVLPLERGIRLAR